MQVENLGSMPYCVYGHFDRADCFYVGSGTWKRAFEFQYDRSTTHKQKMSECDMTVMILHRCSTRDEAYRIEKQMIELFMPPMNRWLANGIRTKNRKEALRKPRAEKRERPKAEYKHVYPIKCIQTGRYFYGGTHAGRAMNLSSAHINAVVLGKTKAVQGYTFRRATWEESGLDRALIGKPEKQDAD